jgi:UDP-glucose 4-epimerase
MRKILVTGGAGYIGTHTLVELYSAGYEFEVLDNFVNSHPEAIKRVEKIIGKSITLHPVDLLDEPELNSVMQGGFTDVIHFAGLKAVGESTKEPLLYYRTNIDSTLNLLGSMLKNNVKNIIFSSSATVYGDPETLPLTEKSPTGVGLTNPYGKTKYFIEEILQDLCRAEDSFSTTILRYFNPIGAHESGLIGEDPNGTPNNLLPYVSQVAVGKLEKLSIFGNDYPTPDGTGVRDYIHVVDLAKGHVAALKNNNARVKIYNLGTGNGTSVLELIKAFEAASGKQIPAQISSRRDGDIAECYADPAKARLQLDWRATKTIAQACEDAWRWQSDNPTGYSIK